MGFPCRISAKSSSTVASETPSRVGGVHAGVLSLSISRARTPSSKSAMVIMCCVGEQAGPRGRSGASSGGRCARVPRRDFGARLVPCCLVSWAMYWLLAIVTQFWSSCSSSRLLVEDRGFRNFFNRSKKAPHTGPHGFLKVHLMISRTKHAPCRRNTHLHDTKIPLKAFLERGRGCPRNMPVRHLGGKQNAHNTHAERKKADRRGIS